MKARSNKASNYCASFVAGSLKREATKGTQYIPSVIVASALNLFTIVTLQTLFTTTCI